MNHLVNSILPIVFCTLAIGGCGSSNDSAEPLALTGENPAGYSFWEDGVALRCEPQLTAVCTNEGCRSGSASTNWLELDPERKQIRRCDQAGCDLYAPQVRYSGIFTVLAVPDSGHMIKISSQGQYVEVATHLLDTVVYRGRCHPSAAGPDL